MNPLWSLYCVEYYYPTFSGGNLDTSVLHINLENISFRDSSNKLLYTFSFEEHTMTIHPYIKDVTFDVIIDEERKKILQLRELLLNSKFDINNISVFGYQNDSEYRNSTNYNIEAIKQSHHGAYHQLTLSKRYKILEYGDMLVREDREKLVNAAVQEFVNCINKYI